MSDQIAKALKQIGLILLVMCIGTVFDWMAHNSNPAYAVPDYYFRNKLIFGTLIGFVALRVLKIFVKSERWLAFGTTLTIAILLQTRYYLEGYDLNFVLIFMVVHFVVFFVPAYILFPIFRRVL